MRPISRRDALLLGGLGTAATVAGGAGLWWSLASPQQPTGGALPADRLRAARPPGTSQRERQAAAHPRRRPRAGGARRPTGAGALCYNGTVPGPTLRLRPGDELGIRLVNSLDEPTNLHVHGLHVSPQANSDNVFVRSCPGQASTTATGCPRTTRRACTGTTRITTAWSQGRSSRGFSGRSSSKSPNAIPVNSERVLIVSDTTLDSAGNIAGGVADGTDGGPGR